MRPDNIIKQDEINRISGYRKAFQWVGLGLLAVGILAAIALLVITFSPVVVGLVGAAAAVATTVLFAVAIAFLAASLISFLAATYQVNKEGKLKINLNGKMVRDNLGEVASHEDEKKTTSSIVQLILNANSETLLAINTSGIEQKTRKNIEDGMEIIAKRMAIVTDSIANSKATLHEVLSNPSAPDEEVHLLTESLQALQERYKELEGIQTSLTKLASNFEEGAPAQLRTLIDEAAPVLLASAASAAETQAAAEVYEAANDAETASDLLVAECKKLMPAYPINVIDEAWKPINAIRGLSKDVVALREQLGNIEQARQQFPALSDLQKRVTEKVEEVEALLAGHQSLNTHPISAGGSKFNTLKVIKDELKKLLQKPADLPLLETLLKRYIPEETKAPAVSRMSPAGGSPGRSSPEIIHVRGGSPEVASEDQSAVSKTGRPIGISKY